MTYKRKLIEVSIPLDVINDASAYDKMPGIGAHPKGIHHWWARLPLPSARAILFASLVDDPSCQVLEHAGRIRKELADEMAGKEYEKFQLAQLALEKEGGLGELEADLQRLKSVKKNKRD
jgi:adenine-specific DNA methylase